MKTIEKEKIKEFWNIVDNKEIYPVFQPIVSLQTGRVMAYEALSRIKKKDSILSIAELFEIADKTGNVWILEKLCRKKALKAAVQKPEGVKLFLNVDGNALQDPSFVGGFTSKKIRKNGLRTQDIVFEITERSDVQSYDALQNIIAHYEKQGYEIALDDVGSGYSGLNRIVYVNPQYLKLDLELIRDIHKNKAKKTMVGMLVTYCKEMDYRLVAEGMENKEELRCLIELGVEYGQGFYLGKPNKDFVDILPEIANEIIETYETSKK